MLSNDLKKQLFLCWNVVEVPQQQNGVGVNRSLKLFMGAHPTESVSETVFFLQCML